MVYSNNTIKYQRDRVKNNKMFKTFLKFLITNRMYLEFCQAINDSSWIRAGRLTHKITHPSTLIAEPFSWLSTDCDRFDWARLDNKWRAFLRETKC